MFKNSAWFAALAVTLAPTLASATSYEDFVYVSSFCVMGKSTLNQEGNLIRIEGHSQLWSKRGNYNDCWAGSAVDGISANRLAVSYYLTKLEGGNLVVCGSNPGWPGWVYNPDLFPSAYLNAGGLKIYSAGCGAGFYNLVVQAYYKNASNVWVGGALSSGWTYMNIPDPPVVH